MSTFNLYGACNQMAVLLAAVTPPTGYVLRKAYPQAPNNTPMAPCAVVFPMSGDMTLSPGTYTGEHKIDVWFLIAESKGDFPRIETERQKWLPVLLHAFDGQMALGLAPEVLKVYPIGWEFDVLTYGGVEYDGIKIHYELDTRETVSLVP